MPLKCVFFIYYTIKTTSVFSVFFRSNIEQSKEKMEKITIKKCYKFTIVMRFRNVSTRSLCVMNEWTLIELCVTANKRNEMKNKIIVRLTSAALAKIAREHKSNKINFLLCNVRC